MERQSMPFPRALIPTLVATLLWGPNCLLVCLLALGSLGPLVSLLLEEEGAEIFVTAEN